MAVVGRWVDTGGGPRLEVPDPEVTMPLTPMPSHRPLDVCLTVAVDDSAASVDLLVREMARARQMDAVLRVVPVHPLAGMTDASMSRMVAAALSRVVDPPRVSCPTTEVAP